MKKKFDIIEFISGVLIFVIFTLIGCAFYFQEGKGEDVIINDDNEMRVYVVEGTTPLYGMVFYVGTVIPPRLYDNIMIQIAEAGYLVVIPYQTHNLAFLDHMAMNRVVERYPDVSFALAGHSQGGLAANFYANVESDNVKGLIYYAAYPYELKRDNIPTLAIIATNDQVVSNSDIENSPNYPEDSTFYYIEGGNHISFASNFSFPDGPLEITIESQQEQTAIQTIIFLNRIFNL